jgi:hypothetical protein
MDNSEAAHSWGRDSLTCKFFLVSSCLIFLTTLFLALRSMLEQINSARNMGNANSALARANFDRADQISTEFLLRLMRLSGEDFSGALLDSIFNEDAAVAFINHLINEVQSEFDDPSPARLAAGFQTILGQVLDSRPSPQPEHQILDDTRIDDIYADDELDEPNDAHLLLQDIANNFIDDEAEEVPEGEESEPEVEDEGLETDDIEDFESEHLADDDEEGGDGSSSNGEQGDADIPSV